MRTDVTTIKAKDLEPGMILCDDNPRFDSLIDDVSVAQMDYVVKIICNDFTYTTYRRQDETVWIKNTA